MLALIPDDDLRSECKKIMEDGKDSIGRWNKMRETCVQYTKNKSWKGRKTSDFIMMEIMIQFAYPRYNNIEHVIGVYGIFSHF